MRFTEREVKDLLISILVIGFAFAWISRDLPRLKEFSFPEILLVMFFAVGTAFALHELAHKISAQKFGCSAEYKIWEMGLILAFFLAVALDFVFAAPGAVYIVPGYFGLSRRQDLIISSSGIATNLALAVLFSILAGIFPSGLPHTAFALGAMVNSIIAFINLLPVPPLDGSKVMRHNFALWLVLIAFAFLLSGIV